MPRGQRASELKFEPWLGKGLTRAGITPRMTVSRRGEIRINRAAAALLSQPRYVRVMFDRRHRAVGLLATNPDDDRGYALRVDGAHDHGRSVGATVALTAAGLLPRETYSTEPALAGNVLYIILPAGVLP